MSSESGSQKYTPVAPRTITQARRRALAFLFLLAGLHAEFSFAEAPKPPRWMSADYAAAVSSFRQARFPEAYGRFVALASWSHAPAARQALWMCEHGQELFGRPFDCTPQEVEWWAIQSGTDPGAAVRRIYPSLVNEARLNAARR